ncbi:hypothetical protein NA57DRAFT_76590 [Rhizodiscina lignyota]|uniref:Copper acquisition factor BIM1-like domain-containing protein n=1 Tax=Rhizodiscina lignyota TaxID=1504668 RepID=A0A9P4M7Y2_9PEZI|nr:hypothetical protein NA57DRAFT_76590 [Rhizodiscina lignyota]
MYSITTFLFPALAAAHFQMHYPHSRGFSEDTIVQYPCGGFNDVESNRTEFPINGGPVQLNMEHTETNVEVLIAFGNNPSGADYHTVLVPTLFERGPQLFCLGDIRIPNAKAGTNATIQVVTNGDPSGGLYACADITLTDTPLSSADFKANCQNSTGVSISYLNTKNNANTTEAGQTGSSGSSSSSSASGSSSASTAAAASSSSTGIAAMATANVMGALAAGAVGLVGIAAAL